MMARNVPRLVFALAALLMLTTATGQAQESVPDQALTEANTEPSLSQAPAYEGLHGVAAVREQDATLSAESLPPVPESPGLQGVAAVRAADADLSAESLPTGPESPGLPGAAAFPEFPGLPDVIAVPESPGSDVAAVPESPGLHGVAAVRAVDVVKSATDSSYAVKVLQHQGRDTGAVPADKSAITLPAAPESPGLRGVAAVRAVDTEPSR